MSRSDFLCSGAGPAFLALSAVGFIASAVPAVAQDAPAEGARLGGMTVTDTAITEAPIKVERVESPKAVRNLLDTPQTITVISNQTIRQQNLLTLRDALSTVPGITFGAGEGGGGYGDSINLRGQSLASTGDITIDGVRDTAQYSRTDPFNLEQIEVFNGPNSVNNGAGSVSGTINLVTKRPKAENLTVLSAGVGTDDYWRGTVDSNLRLNEKIAFRLNAVVHRNDYPGRDVDRYKRWGVAPALTFGIGEPTSVTLLYTHQEDKNTPLYGVPYYNNALYDGKLPGVADSDYFGYRNVDRQDQNIDQATIIFDHEFNDMVKLRNLSRWQRVAQDLVVDPPQGTYCLASTNRTPTGAACAVDLDTRDPQTFNVTVPAGYYLPSGPRGNARFSENQTLYNQLDVTFNFAGGHTLVVGGSISQEDYKLSSGNVLRNANGTNPVAFDPSAPSANAHLPYINIANPNAVSPGPAIAGGVYGSNTYTGPLNYIASGAQTGEATQKAIYAFTAIKLFEQLEFNGGARYENYKSSFRSDTIAVGGAFTPGATQKGDDNLFSYRAALVYKPIPNASVYVAYGNSRNPISTSTRSGCGIAAATTGGANPCATSPEKAVNYEIGGKIDLFDKALQLTAALFRNERTNFRVASNDPLVGSLPVNDGRSKVDGIAIGASGRITDAWTIFANYTYLKTKVKQSISDFCLANPGRASTVGGTTNTCPAYDPQAGAQLTNTPKHAGSLFTTYTLPFKLQLGYGLTYQGSFLLNNALTTPTTVLYRSKDYLTHRAFVSYPVTDKLTAQVNVQNFTNEKYYTSIRNNGWALPGEDRQATLSLYYTF